MKYLQPKYLGVAVFFIVVIALCIHHYVHVFDFDCSDFGSQEEAQKVFNRHPDDRYRLDQNNNKKACEELPITHFHETA